jgi:ribosomal 50S subunit-recycling heat shock protein
MRLDKYLKVSRIIKRRTLAKEVADSGRVSINGLEAKASSKVKVGDELTLKFGQKILTVKVEAISENAKKADADQLYSIVSEERIESPTI